MANPILDANAISDLQSRMAAIEAALGKYNQANAVAGIIPTQSSGTTSSPSTSTGSVKEYSPANNKIYYGVLPMSFTENSGVTSGQISITFPQAFADAPTVIVTPRVYENGAAVPAAAYVGSITTSAATVRVRRLSGSSGSGSLHFIVIGR